MHITLYDHISNTQVRLWTPYTKSITWHHINRILKQR